MARCNTATTSLSPGEYAGPLDHPELSISADVVVIGCGFIGVYAAYLMSRRGTSAALVEKGRINTSVLRSPRRRDRGRPGIGRHYRKGVIKTRRMVVVGGALASSFCDQLGIRFLQASVRSSILSVMLRIQGLTDTLHTSEVTVTRRGDGGYTLVISGRTCVDLTPWQLRFSSYFLPMFAKRWQMLSPGNLQGWQYGHETRSKYAFYRPTRPGLKSRSGCSEIGAAVSPTWGCRQRQRHSPLLPDACRYRPE